MPVYIDTKKEKLLKHKYLLKIIDYCSKTGNFTWKINKSNVKSGDIAGYYDKINGYIIIRINRKAYKAHRLAWFYTYKVWPIEQLDHKDKDKTNNKLKNLRLANHFENCANSGLKKNNSTGYKGVYYRKDTNKFCAQLLYKKKRYNLGSYTTAEQAYEKYCLKVAKLHKDYAFNVN